MNKVIRAGALALALAAVLAAVTFFNRADGAARRADCRGVAVSRVGAAAGQSGRYRPHGAEQIAALGILFRQRRRHLWPRHRAGGARLSKEERPHRRRHRRPRHISGIGHARFVRQLFIRGRQFGRRIYRRGHVPVGALYLWRGARGELYRQVAVGAVVLNRVKSPEFPNTIAASSIKRTPLPPSTTDRSTWSPTRRPSLRRATR